MGEPASLHRPSDIPAATGRSKDLRPSWSGLPRSIHVAQSGPVSHPLLPQGSHPGLRMQLTQTGVQASQVPIVILGISARVPAGRHSLRALAIKHLCSLQESRATESTSKARLYSSVDRNFPSLFFQIHEEDEACSSSYEVFKHEVPPLYPSPLSQDREAEESRLVCHCWSL